MEPCGMMLSQPKTSFKNKCDFPLELWFAQPVKKAFFTWCIFCGHTQTSPVGSKDYDCDCDHETFRTTSSCSAAIAGLKCKQYHADIILLCMQDIKGYGFTTRRVWAMHKIILSSSHRNKHCICTMHTYVATWEEKSSLCTVGTPLSGHRKLPG